MTDVAAQLVLGGAQLGGLLQATSDDEVWETLERAWDVGVRQFDTAPHYGAGLSERRLGLFLATKPRQDFVVSTKVGRLLVPTDEDVEGVEGFYGGDRNRRVLDYSTEGVLRSVDESLERLGLDRVDTLYVHDPDDHLDEAISAAIPALVCLRRQGVVDHVGAGMNFTEPLVRIVTETEADQIMLAGRYSLLDRSAESALLPRCLERDVHVVAVGVYNSGLLADPVAGATYDYAPTPAEVLERARAVQRACAAYDVPLRAAALQFPLRHAAVTQVGVGCRGAAQVDDNVAMFGADVPEELWDELGWEENR